MRSLKIIFLLAGKYLRIVSRSKATLAVMFLPGIVLYTIFTNIFEGPAGSVRPFRVAVIDEDETAASRNLIEALAQSNIRVIRTVDESAGGPPLTLESAKEAIRRRGNFRVAILIPKGYAESPTYLQSPTRHRGLIMYYDELEPTEAEIAGGMIQMAAGRNVFEGMFGALGAKKEPTTRGESRPQMLVKIERHDVHVKRMKNAAKHAFLAGIVPMFLLFSSAGAARSLLEELKSGELRRLLVAPIRPKHILLGQMLSVLVMQFIQCYVMYLYAWLIFDVAIWQIAVGLFALTMCTAVATTAFGMLLGSLCKTAEQLDAIGTTVILSMSAIGGSMVPRHVMPGWMKPLGLLTINGWSYDGFMSVFAFEGLAGLGKPCAVLVGVAVASATIGSLILNRRLLGSGAGR